MNGKKGKKKAKEVEAKEVKPTVEAKEVVEAKPPTKSQPPIEVKPQKTKEAKEVKVTPITLEEFESFTPTPNEKEKRKSIIKEVIERARREPVKIEGLTKGQILALIRALNDYNFRGGDPKIVYKYDIKRSIVLLAPKSLYEESKYIEALKEVFENP